MGFRQLSGRGGMLIVIVADAAHAGNRLGERGKNQEARARRQMSGQAGILDERRLAGGQVADRAVAEPSAAGVDVDALGDGELRGGVQHVVAELQRPAGDQRGIDEPPTIGQELVAVCRIRRVDVQGDLEFIAAQRGQTEELAELMDLEPERAAGERDWTEGASPIGDRGEGRGVRVPTCGWRWIGQSSSTTG